MYEKMFCIVVLLYTLAGLAKIFKAQLQMMSREIECALSLFFTYNF